MNLDQRQNNMVKALAVAGVSLFLVMGFYSFFVQPILDKSMEGYRETCYDEINGELVEKENVTCSVPSYPLFPIALGVIPFFIFIAMFEFLEKRRIHNWRSWK